MRLSLLHPITRLGLFALLCLPVVVVAQTAPAPYHMASYALDSGQHTSQGTEAAAAFSAIVEMPGAPWLRLSFAEAHLGAGSYLTVTSLQDGAQQRLDAAALAQWQHTSAYFNGDALQVTLYVAPGDQGVFARMSEVMVGDYGAPESQCGPTDDRVASNDARVGRVMFNGCTGWLIHDNKVVTAGHCISGASVLQFNVPQSLSSGTVQHPGPEDQYSIDFGSRVWVNGGVGNDWGVFEVFDNSQTGQQPHTVQGAIFTLRQDLGPPNIRITGYGVDSGSANQTQQTHVGPNAGSSGTTMRYQTDTTGGNSGSPVIDDATDTAVGVHSHGGCSTSGSGNNNGTSTFNTAFWAALDVPTGPDVSITCTALDDPIVIPVGGGDYRFTVEVVNNSATTQSFDGWVDVTGPGTSTLGPIAATLPGGGSVTRTYRNRVSASEPAGTYTHTCKVGTFPGTVMDESSFTWSKGTSDEARALAAAPQFGDPAAGPLEADAPHAASAPADLVLEGTYPNPFNPSTVIRYALPQAQQVRLAVYDLLGREVAVLVEGYLEAGAHEARFDATGLSAGVYLYTIQAGAVTSTQRMTLLE